MKVVQINTTCGIGSTGKICVGISQILCENDIENYILYSHKSDGYALGIPCMSNAKYVKLQALKSRIFGNYGFNSRKATRKMIAELDRIQPDVVHLHNLHGHDCDLEMLFTYFREKQTKLIWTFHDCWAFTGYCTYFTMSGCDRWKTSCENCPQRRQFAWFFDKSHTLFEKKKALFAGLDLTIVTPSQWLADIVKQSFLQAYPVRVINNGIALDVFQHTSSDVRQTYHLENKKVILGVALGWEKRKGLDVFVALSEQLPEDYQIVLVGTNDVIDRELPDNILSIHRTQNPQELASLYSVADVFVNPTREEVLGMVNLESLACGTPGITFDSGGSPECYDPTCGSVVPCDDVEALTREIVRICSDRPYSRDACIRRAQAFDQNERFREYLTLYQSVTP